MLLFSADIPAAEDIQLESPDGSTHHLNEYIGQGKWVVLNIWGTACPPCREEMPELVLFHDQHHTEDAMVVGIAIDFPGYGYADREEVRTFADDYLIDFPLLLSDAEVTVKLGMEPLQGLPTSFLYNPAGKLVAMHVGALSKQELEAAIKKYKLKARSSHR